MFISRAELEKRQTIKKVELKLDDDINEDVSTVEKLHNGGANYSLEPSQRTLIGVLSKFDTSEKVGRAFGVSGNHVRSNLRHGRHNGEVRADEEEPDPAFVKAEEELRETIADKALSLTRDALQGVDLDDIEKPMQKIVAAEKLVKIVGNLSPKSEGPKSQSIIFYSPRVRGEEEYEKIDV